MKVNTKAAAVSIIAGIVIFGSAYYYMVLKPKKDAEKNGTSGNTGTGGSTTNTNSSSGSSSGNGFIGPIMPSWWPGFGTSTEPTKDPTTGFYIGQHLKATNITPAYNHPVLSPSDIAYTTSIGDEIGVFAGTVGSFIKVTARKSFGDWISGAGTYYIQKTINPTGI